MEEQIDWEEISARKREMEDAYERQQYRMNTANNGGGRNKTPTAIKKKKNRVKNKLARKSKRK